MRGTANSSRFLKWHKSSFQCSRRSDTEPVIISIGPEDSSGQDERMFQGGAGRGGAGRSGRNEELSPWPWAQPSSARSPLVSPSLQRRRRYGGWRRSITAVEREQRRQGRWMRVAQGTREDEEGRMRCDEMTLRLSFGPFGRLHYLSLYRNMLITPSHSFGNVLLQTRTDFSYRDLFAELNSLQSIPLRRASALKRGGGARGASGRKEPEAGRCPGPRRGEGTMKGRVGECFCFILRDWAVTET